MDLNSLVGRIKKISEREPSINAFAKRINENPTKFSHIFSGRNNPSLDLIMKICAAYPDVTADWLIYGTNKTSPQVSSTASFQTDSVEPSLFSAPVVPTDTIHALHNEKMIDTNSNETGTIINDHDTSMQSSVQTTVPNVQTSQRKVKSVIIMYDDNTYEIIKA